MSLFLVTGGCGFIGSHLCDALAAAGHEIRVLDDLSTGKRENLPPRAELVVGSVTDRAAVSRAIEDVAGCFHLAAIASVERGRRDWLLTHQTNVGGTVTLFDVIAHTGRTSGPRIKVVYASSAAVYGEPSSLPLTEDAPKRPLSAYGVDKYASELHAAVATHVHGIPTVGLRFFNVYGARQDPHSPYSGVISIFAEKLARHSPITIYGDGEQTRDFVYVADVVHALWEAMAQPLAEAPVFNVCTGVATSVRELAASLGGVLGVTPEIVHGPARDGEIRHSVGMPALARKTLHLAGPTPLADGLARLLEKVTPKTEGADASRS